MSEFTENDKVVLQHRKGADAVQVFLNKDTLEIEGIQRRKDNQWGEVELVEATEVEDLKSKVETLDSEKKVLETANKELKKELTAAKKASK